MTALLVLGGSAVVAVAPATADPLPAGYGLELVAPPFSLGQAVQAQGLAPDGKAVILGSTGALEDAGNAPDVGGTFYARRTEEGWRTIPMMPPASVFPTWGTNSASAIDVTADGRKMLWWVQRREDLNTRRLTPVLSDVDGRTEIAGPTVDDSAPGLGSDLIAASADLHTIVIKSVRRNVATDGASDTRAATRPALYVSRPSPDALGEFRVRQLAFRAGATMLPSCEVMLGSARSARGAVSDDGRRIFFSFGGGFASCVTAANQRVWVRDGDAEAEDRSASQCTTNCGAAAPAFFEVASYDGQRVYFTTEQKLLDGDQDDSTQADLYVHDMAYAGNNRLRAVTASGAAGQGAGVLGVVRASEDGAYVYFVANGRPLAGVNARGDTPQSGENNLYVYHRPRSPLSAPGAIRFVARLEAADVDRSTQFSLLNAQNRPVVISSNGRYLLFTAFSDLTGEKQPGDAHRDLYRYDVASDDLIRVWSADPAHNGAARTAGIWPADIGPKEFSQDGARQKTRREKWAISDDGGTAAFSTAEPLSPDDANARRDAYMWREDTGKITLLSGGRSILDLGAAGVSRDGDVVFHSDAPLVPEHRSGAVTTFIARRGGGFAAPPSPPDPCSGDACQGPPVGPSLLPRSVGTSIFDGDGKAVVSTLGLSVSGQRAVRGSRARLTVTSTVAGRVAIRGNRLVRGEQPLRAGRRTAVSIRLTSTGRRLLSRGRTVKVRVSLGLVATDGGTDRRTVTVTFRPTKRGR